MLSNKATYALKALTHLADAAPATASVSAMAAAAGTPRKFLEAILGELRSAGLVESRLGRSGGYALARPAARISVAEIVRVVDGALALKPCASRTAYRACDDCADVETCRIREILLEGRDALAEVLERRTLADLCGAAPQAPSAFLTTVGP